MKNNDIKTSTPVRHPEGGDYVIQRQSMNGAGEVLTVALGKDLHASAVFDGSPDEARKHGFLFGDEGTEPTCDVCGAHEAEQEWCGNCGCCLIHCQKQEGCIDKDAVIAELKTRNNAMAVELEARSGTISDLRGEVASLTSDMTTLRNRINHSDRALSEFKERVRNEVESAKNEHDLCIDGCNAFLEELGLPLLSKKWKVQVVRDSDYETVLTVSGVEADDEDDARDKVKDNFTVSATVRRVDYDYDYTGDGDTDWDHEDYSDTDSDDDGDDFADAHRDAFTFVVEEA
jgi:hypothetical protein